MGIKSKLQRAEAGKPRHGGVTARLRGSLRGCLCAEAKRRCPEDPVTSKKPERPLSPALRDEFLPSEELEEAVR